MTLWIQISSGASEPIYEQIVAQVGRAVAGGELSVGDKLPPVRRLASELVINPNTVAKAYNILERQGLVSSKTGSGTFVADPALRHTDAAQVNILAERIDNVIAQGLNLGLGPPELRKMFDARLSRFLQGAKRRRGKK